MPIGYIIAYGREAYICVNEQNAKLPCNGGWLRKSEYPELYSILCIKPKLSYWRRFLHWINDDTPKGICVYGENSHSFRLPDLQGRYISH